MQTGDTEMTILRIIANAINNALRDDDRIEAREALMALARAAK